MTTNEAVSLVAVIILLAAINYEVVDYLQQPLKAFAWYTGREWIVIYVAFVTGFLLAWFAGVNVLSEVAPVITDPWVGRVVTGALVGMGSRRIHDLLDKPL